MNPNTIYAFKHMLKQFFKYSREFKIKKESLAYFCGYVTKLF